MTDEDGLILIKATKNKGRSASVCFSSSSRSDRAVDCVNISPPLTPPATSNDVKYFRRPASRSQSARLTGGKSLRRRPPQPNSGDSADDTHGHRIRAGVSDPRLYRLSGSETCSPGSLSREGSVRQVNSIHNSHSQRKSTAFLGIPQAQPANQEVVDDNSYRLRSFSFTTKGLVNRGDSFRRRHGRCNSICPNNEENLETRRNEVVDSNLATEKTCGSPSDSGVITYNVSVMGATGVGKTSLISQFMTSECINPYDRDRDEPCQQTVSIMLNGEESELRFHELKHSNKIFQKRYVTDAFLILYSVVDKSTFQYAETELSKLHDSNILLNKPAILVANKIDLARSRTVSSQDGKCLACTFRVKHVEISVGINHNVDELLVGILNQIRLKKQRCEQENATHRWYKNRAMIRASMKARQMFTWIFGREDSKFKNCENLHTL